MPEFAHKARFEDCLAIKKTPKALLVELPNGVLKLVPDSQIDDDSEVWQVGDDGVLVVNEWWAEQEGLM